MLVNTFISIIEKKLFYGRITVTLPNGEVKVINGANFKLEADIKINNTQSFIAAIIKKGDIGLGESYINNYWESNNLTNLLILLSYNLDHLSTVASCNSIWSLLFRLINFFRGNSKKQSEKNISAHYNIGNDFYQLWLDKTMTYSSALFINGNENLQEAQLNKYHRILGQLSEKFHDKPLNILEIGCGFGGFAEEALKKGHKVTAITNSKNQFAFAKNRLQEYSQKGDLDLQLIDYRDIKGEFDAIVSIGMFEHLGKQYWDTYFTTIKTRLSKGGRAVIQTIYIADKYFAEYQNSSDFIRQYIFPGGLLPSDKVFIEKATSNHLTFKTQFSFGESYAKTLTFWLQNFMNHLSEVKALGYNQQFIKKWQYYLASCIAAFTSKRTSVAQFTLDN